MYVLSREYYPDPTCALAVARAAASPPPRVPMKLERPLVYICSPFAGDEEQSK